MIGKVQNVELSKSGKSYSVTIDGAKYSYKTTTPPSVGDEVEFATEDNEYNGRIYKFISKLRKVEGATNTKSSINPDAARLTSNVVAAACTAKLIQNPTELRQWIITAYSAYLEATEGKEASKAEEDEIPF